jgi:hypothetical protein
VDGRTTALRVLGAYLAEIVFRRAGPTGGEPIAFRFRDEDIHIEWPDHEDAMQFPSVVMLSTGPADYNAIGLTAYYEEATKDVYAPGTVLYWSSEYTENIALEIWCNTKAERRAIKAGLEIALVPVQQMYGIRFSMPDYFNELVCFSLDTSEVYDEADGARGRRRLRMMLEMRFNQIALVNYTTMTPIACVNAGTSVTPSPNVSGIPPVRQDPNEPPGIQVENPLLPRT